MEENTNNDSSGGVLFGSFLLEASLISKFAMRFFRAAFKLPVESKELLKQSFLIGNKSLPLVAITGFIMGLVFTIQSRPTLLKVGAESWLPAMISVSIITEIGPVVTALICAGRVGSGIGAELASMKVTEQIDAMEVSGTNPFKYVVATRITATMLMVPLLAIFSDVVGLFGAFLGINIKGDLSFHLFLFQAFNYLDFIDVFPALIKTVFFGFAIGLIGCYQGFNATFGTEGVGKAANSSVVIASLLIFIIDMIAVQITNLFMY